MASFQGPGTGISGTSNQFSVGYAQSSGYTNGNIGGYAPVAGNANGYVPQAGYANQASATAQTLQLTNASSSTWAWQGQNSTPAWLWGSNQGTSDTVFAPGNLQVGYAQYAGTINGNIGGYAPSATNATATGYATYAQGGAYGNNLAIPYGANGYSTWYWQGQGGIPNHYWGSNDGVNMFVWQGNQGYVGFAQVVQGTNTYVNYAGSAANVGYASQASWAYYTPAVGQGTGQTGNGLSGACGGIRQGWVAKYGNHWGNGYSAYNRQGQQQYANFNIQYGSYYSLEGWWYGNNWTVMGYQWQSNTSAHLFGVPNTATYLLKG